MGSDEGVSRLHAHLHELAEGLQAAINFIEVLRAGGQQVDAGLVEKTAAQLRRAQQSFGHVRNHVESL